MDVVDAIGNLQRVDLANALQDSAFGAVPVLRKDAEGVGIEDLVQINRVYATDNIDSSLGALAEFDGQSVTFPVHIGPKLYEATLDLIGNSPSYVFQVDRNQIIPLEDTGQEAAEFTSSSGVLSIPSVKVGQNIFTDVTLNLTNSSTLEFTLASFNRQ